MSSVTKKNFTINVLNKLEDIYINGIYSDEKHYSINKIITIYIKNMKEKFKSLGPTYLINMVKDVENIINNLTIKSNYDNIEFVNSILHYCIKSIDYTHKKINNLPNLPDYTISEIKDMAKSL
jgi:hypothetical protein